MRQSEFKFSGDIGSTSVSGQSGPEGVLVSIACHSVYRPAF